MILLNQSTNHLPLHDDVKRAMIEFSPADVNTYGQATGSDELKNIAVCSDGTIIRRSDLNDIDPFDYLVP